ncbi:porin family protein [Flavobacterium saccharophilum]|uniref:Outer membrane protein beta-barrel domain-containing protein n=1 Tax=Flavobacterium saccharophilum TaxID=29534 RepID=A0A1M7L8T1_9FLAO|nr:porin family protein [Flavobacterium saccharophilum]SHM73762.1 Outer membrane protein beta-barrel domain-containing protein [Flavobacterium saccharophilum]
MKKSMLVLCTLLLCATVTAQTDKVKIGVKAGLNISSLTSDENELDSSDKTGFTAGIMAEIPLAKNFSIQPEVLYSQQGMKFSYSDVDVQNSHYKSTIGLNYLNIPVMLKYYVVKGLSVQAGPQIGILLKANNKYQDNFLGYENHETFNLSDYANGIDTAVNFGLGYQFKNKFYTDLRYTISYSDIFKDASANTYIINSDMKNRVFQITVGYFFK